MIAPDWFRAAGIIAYILVMAAIFCIICLRKPPNPQDHETDHHHDQEGDA